MNYVLEHQNAPGSVFLFCKEIGIKEDAFYNEYGSFNAIEKEIWRELVKDTVTSLQADPNYKGFGSREKVLSFYYALVETMKGHRSFLLINLQGWKVPGSTPSFLNEFRKEFDTWIKAVIEEGKASNEVAQRQFLDQQYPNLFWVHFLFILHFWSRDDSKAFEATDSAIEKSVNLAFELMGKGALDQALDFAKFMFHQSRN